MKNMMMIAMMAVTGACGAANESENFVGQWEYTNSNSTLSCPTLNVSESGTIDGVMTFSPGYSADLVSLEEGCSLDWDIAGDLATLRPGQTCNDSLSAGTTLAIDFKSGTFVVRERMSEINLTADVELNAKGQVFPCTYSAGGQMLRITR